MIGGSEFRRNWNTEAEAEGNGRQGRRSLMDRRETLKAVALAVGGSRLLAGHVESEAVPTLNNNSRESRSNWQPYVETSDGTHLFYQDWGTGKPVLFIHGLGSSSQQWQYNMVPLSMQGLRCVAYDRRGHGRSTHPGRGYDYEMLADDLTRVIGKLDLQGVTLVGHSMGAGEIVRYVSRQGANRVARIVMVGPTLPFILKTADNPDGVDRSVLEQLRASWCKDFPKWVTDNARAFFTPETSDAQVQWGVNLMVQTSLKAIIECNLALTETDFRHELTRITLPCLIVHGDKDVSARIDFTGCRTANLIKGSQFKVYPGAAHGLFITHAEQFNKDIAAFAAS